MTITLNLIMKNESKVIIRLLETVLPFIDRYDIVDTGSEDNTIELAKEFFKIHNIPGEIYHRPFDNFQNSRNYAFEMAKGKADYIFMIDSDEQLILPKYFNKDIFKSRLEKFDKAMVTMLYNENTYGRACIFSTKKPFKWVGVVHEVMICEEQVTQTIFDEIKVFVSPDGNSWNNIEQKYADHAKMLLAEVNEKNSPRDIFYLAQSYRDAKMYEHAIKWYKIRVEMNNGFFEEIYYSQFMLGYLKSLNQELIGESIRDYLICYEIDDMRAEHFLNICVLLQQAEMFKHSLIYSTFAMKYHNRNPYPHRVLFIDSLTYSEKLLNTYLYDCKMTNTKVNYSLFNQK